MKRISSKKNSAKPLGLSPELERVFREGDEVMDERLLRNFRGGSDDHTGAQDRRTRGTRTAPRTDNQENISLEDIYLREGYIPPAYAKLAHQGRRTRARRG